MKIIFDPNQVQCVAEFLNENHRSLKKSVDEWESYLYDYIVQYHNSSTSWIATAGFVMSFGEIDSETIEVEVFVDASIGEGVHFIEASIVDGKIIKEFN